MKNTILSAILLTVLCACETITPTVPTQTATPTITPSPTQTSEKVDLVLMLGETSEIRLNPGPKPKMEMPEGLTAECLEYKAVKTLRPSFIGAEVGFYNDALVPCTDGKLGLWIDITASRTATPGKHKIKIGNVEYTVQVLNAVMPEKPSVPFYGEIASVTMRRLAGTPDHVSNEAKAVKEWSAFLRAHRIEPMKQYLSTYPPSNLDQWKEFGADFYSVVVEGAIAPPMVIRFEHQSNPSAASLQAVEAAMQAGKIPQGAWAYVVDEGQPELLEMLKSKSDLIKQHAPSLKRYATWEPLESVKTYLDGFWPVLDWFKASGRTQNYSGLEYGLYTSCMAQGNCAEGPARNATGTPLSVIEAPEIHLMMFPVVGYALGAKRLMYYKLDKFLQAAWQDGGQWNEGGNGDGTTLYFIEGGKPSASVRLKGWRYGMNSIEYLKLLGMDGKTLVQSPREWTKNKTDLEALRFEAVKRGL